MPKLVSFPLTALHASDGTKLTKTKDSSYPNVFRFTSSEHNITSIPAFHKAINEIAKTGGCLLKGFVQRPLVNESRAGSTNPDEITPWLCLDLDGLFAKNPQAFIANMPKEFKDVTFICQYSASHGIKKGLRCHLFFRLTKPLLPAIIKSYLTHLNLTIPMIRKSITLSKTKMSLKYPLDISVCQNDKLIYVAPPEYKTKFKGKRIILFAGRRTSVALDTTRVDLDTNKLAIHQLVNELRKDQGVAERKFLTKQSKDGMVLRNPNECEVTGEKEERGFKYLNLNGGDSWGYWHQIGHNEILHNFKGEPDYLIKEIIPRYYADIRKTPSSEDPPNVAKELDGSDDEPLKSRTYIGIRDKKSDKYWAGVYDPNTDELDVDPIGSKDKMRDFLKEHGTWYSDYIIPTWNVTYDFHSPLIYDEASKKLNLYKKSEYMKAAEGYAGTCRLPPNIKQVIDHVFNYQADITEHFINWLAFVFQQRKQTRTAWVLHGTQGTGKGILFNQIIVPILGNDYTTRTTLPAYEQIYNSFMDRSLCILIDECQVSDLGKQSTAMSNIKQLITDDQVSLRKMQTDFYTVPNNSNFILASNKYDPIQIDTADRRFNVGPRQEEPLLTVMSETDIDKVKDELQSFTNYMMHYKVDIRAAHKIMKTDEWYRLQHLTQDSGEEVAEQLRQGNLKFFVDNAPDHEDTMQFEIKSGFDESNGPRTYKSLIDLLIKHRGEHINLTRDELRVLFYYVNNLSWATPHKFTKYAGHKGLKIEAVYVKGISSRGIRGLVFQCDDATIKNWQKKHAPKTKPKNVRRIK